MAKKKAEVAASLPNPDTDYMARNDAECLQKAEEIKADPKRMKAAMALLGKAKKHITSLEDIHSLANQDMDTEEEASDMEE